MAKSGGSAGVQRKLSGIDVGMVTYSDGKYTIPVRGFIAASAARDVIRKAGLSIVSERTINEHTFNGWRELIARRKG